MRALAELQVKEWWKGGGEGGRGKKEGRTAGSRSFYPWEGCSVHDRKDGRKEKGKGEGEARECHSFIPHLP